MAISSAASAGARSAAPSASTRSVSKPKAGLDAGSTRTEAKRAETPATRAEPPPTQLNPRTATDGPRNQAGNGALGTESLRADVERNLPSRPTLREGARGAEVSDLQESLKRNGADPGDIDGKFGPQTEAAVKQYQTDKGLQVDGVAGPETWGSLQKADAAAANKPAETKPAGADGATDGTTGSQETLRDGAKGEAVKDLQNKLKAAGVDPGKVDGKFGPRTEAAVKQYQAERGLKQDGVVGPKTWDAIDKNMPKKPGATTAAGTPTNPADVAALKSRLPTPLQKYADTFVSAGNKHGVDPRFLAAISMHETGNGTSSAFRNKRNAMGVSNRRGPISFGRTEDSIDMMARTLAKPNGYYAGKNTVGSIANTYAPVGAANDPTGLNGYWAKGVLGNMRRLGVPNPGSLRVK